MVHAIQGFLCSSEKPARAQLADLADARFGLEQGARFLNYKPASQSCLRCSAVPTGLKTINPDPVGVAEHRRAFGDK